MKNVICFEDTRSLRTMVVQDLKEMGVKAPKAKKMKSEDKPKKGIFGNSIGSVPSVYVENCGNVPKFLVDAFDVVNKHINTEGLFRKAGSVARQKDIRQLLDNGGQLDKDSSHIFDVTSLIKQFFRDLPESLLTTKQHDTFIKSFSLPNEKDRVKAILLACLLLPIDNISALKYTMQCCANIASHSSSNKMNVTNLAVVLTPNLINMNNKNEKMNQAEGELLKAQTGVIELLITHADEIGIISDDLAERSAVMAGFATDDELGGRTDDELDDTSKSTKKKKRRSGSLQGIVVGISNSIAKWRGGSSKGNSSSNSMQVPADAVDAMEVDSSTSVIIDARAQATPRLMRKRKAEEETVPFSASKKKAILQQMPHMNRTPFTPGSSMVTRAKAQAMAAHKYVLESPSIKFTSGASPMTFTATPSQEGGTPKKKHKRLFSSPGSFRKKRNSSSGGLSPNEGKKKKGGLFRRLSGGRNANSSTVSDESTTLSLSDSRPGSAAGFTTPGSGKKRGSLFKRHKRHPSSPARFSEVKTTRKMSPHHTNPTIQNQKAEIIIPAPAEFSDVKPFLAASNPIVSMGQKFQSPSKSSVSDTQVHAEREPLDRCQNAKPSSSDPCQVSTSLDQFEPIISGNVVIKNQTPNRINAGDLAKMLMCDLKGEGVKVTKIDDRRRRRSCDVYLKDSTWDNVNSTTNVIVNSNMQNKEHKMYASHDYENIEVFEPDGSEGVEDLENNSNYVNVNAIATKGKLQTQTTQSDIYTNVSVLKQSTEARKISGEEKRASEGSPLRPSASDSAVQSPRKPIPRRHRRAFSAPSSKAGLKRGRPNTLTNGLLKVNKARPSPVRLKDFRKFNKDEISLPVEIPPIVKVKAKVQKRRSTNPSASEVQKALEEANLMFKNPATENVNMEIDNPVTARTSEEINESKMSIEHTLSGSMIISNQGDQALREAERGHISPSTEKIEMETSDAKTGDAVTNDGIQDSNDVAFRTTTQLKDIQQISDPYFISSEEGPVHVDVTPELSLVEDSQNSSASLDKAMIGELMDISKSSSSSSLHSVHSLPRDSAMSRRSFQGSRAGYRSRQESLPTGDCAPRSGSVLEQKSEPTAHVEEDTGMVTHKNCLENQVKDSTETKATMNDPDEMPDTGTLHEDSQRNKEFNNEASENVENSENKEMVLDNGNSPKAQTIPVDSGVQIDSKCNVDVDAKAAEERLKCGPSSVSLQSLKDRETSVGTGVRKAESLQDVSGRSRVKRKGSFREEPVLKISVEMHNLLSRAGVLPKQPMSTSSSSENTEVSVRRPPSPLRIPLAQHRANEEEKVVHESVLHLEKAKKVTENVEVFSSKAEEQEIVQRHQSPLRFPKSHLRNKGTSPVRVPTIFAKNDKEGARLRELAMKVAQRSPSVKRPRGAVSLPISTNLIRTAEIEKTLGRFASSSSAGPSTPETQTGTSAMSKEIDQNENSTNVVHTPLQIPTSLQETIDDVCTPLSEKIAKQGDRIPKSPLRTPLQDLNKNQEDRPRFEMRSSVGATPKIKQALLTDDLARKILRTPGVGTPRHVLSSASKSRQLSAKKYRSPVKPVKRLGSPGSPRMHKSPRRYPKSPARPQGKITRKKTELSPIPAHVKDEFETF